VPEPTATIDQSSDEGSSQRSKSYKDYENAIQAGFQLATASGPLCGEPMSGVAFFIEDFKIDITPETDGE
jgi:ribosome assembly protein 1